MASQTPPTRTEIFRQASVKLRNDFHALSIIPHKGNKGHEAEGIVKQFLSERLPKRFGVGAGFVLDSRDSVSGQTDVVIYDAHNCPIFMASDDSGMYPIENVAGIISVRSNLDKSAIEDAWKQAETIKAMKRSGQLHYYDVQDPSVKSSNRSEELFQVDTTMTALFAFDSTLSDEKIEEHYQHLFKSKGYGHHLDMIVLLDRCVVMMATNFQNSGWVTGLMGGMNKELALDCQFATAIYACGNSTLDLFFRHLLAHLAHFKPIVTHPGFDVSALPGNNTYSIRYLGKFEPDPNFATDSSDGFQK